MARDPLNFFSPYENLPPKHENQPTRALLVVLRLSPAAHMAWLRLGALAVLPEGRVVSGGVDGRLLVWEPGAADSQPRELGRHETRVMVLAVLPEGQVVSGGDDGRMLLWDAAAQREIAQVGGMATALAAVRHLDPDGISLAIAHRGGGLSFWSIRAA